MKTLLSILSTMLSLSAFGQGQVLFVNRDKTVTPNILALVTDADDGHALVGNEARAALLGGPAETGVPCKLLVETNWWGDKYLWITNGNLKELHDPNDGSTWVNFRTGTAAGYINGSPRILTDVGYSSAAMLQMVVWTGNYPDWQSALSAWRFDGSVKVGVSAPWLVTTTHSLIDPLFPSNFGLNAFTIHWQVALHPPPSQPVWRQTSAPSTPWYSLAASADATKLVAAATQGLVCVSTNAGLTWEPVTLTTNVPIWLGLASSADGVRLTATANLTNQFFLSKDSGHTWAATPLPQQAFGVIHSSADGATLLFDAGSSLSLSQDGGLTWTNFPGPGPGLKATSATGERVVANLQGPQHPVWLSTNFGLTWFTTSSSNVTPGSVAISADGTTILASKFSPGGGAPLYVSRDSGATWATANLPDIFVDWGPLVCSADGTKLAARTSRDIWLSEDAGKSWRRTGFPGGGMATGLAMSADGGRLVAASQDTKIYTLELSPRPVLKVTPSGTNVHISWIIPSNPFVLQESAQLSSANWTEVTTQPQLNYSNLNYEVTVPAPAGSRFYRLAASSP